MQKLTKAQENVLAGIKDMTAFKSGTKKGQRKRYVNCDCYDQRTISALARRELIVYGFEKTNGTGWAVK